MLLPHNPTREQVAAWLAERDHVHAMRRVLGQFHGREPKPYMPEWCEASAVWERRCEMHGRINLRGERAKAFA